MSRNKYYRVPEKFQLQARQRRLRQQQRDGKITDAEALAGLGSAVEDYSHRNDAPIFAQTPFVEVLEEEK